MLKLYCDNCGAEIPRESKRYIWFKPNYFVENEGYSLDLCDKCYKRFIKHIRRTVQMYKKAGNNDKR